jgi:hypothetical protein
MFTYTAKLAIGTWYTLTDASHGSLAANGNATFVVNPKGVNSDGGPASGAIVPGSAPYADDLIIQVATTPSPTTFTVPISWTVDGAVLSLPQGTGPNGQGFYVADSITGFTLPMLNTGNASAGVNFAIQPDGAFTFSPMPPPAIQVTPNVEAFPELVSGPAGPNVPSCPSSGTGITPNATATFLYSGPICQPFGVTTIRVFACAGAYP